MNPSKVVRDKVDVLTDLPNIGPSLAEELRAIGILSPDDLRGRDPWELYRALCAETGSRQDPCVLDVFMAITDFMNGGEPRVWWAYTAERKRRYGTGKKAVGK
jgi:hypothetical protein